jgi:polyvinyl alcohol dehydrogenase (cytochrome)
MGGGYIGSPTVTEQGVYVANRNGRLNALDRRTGAPLWEAKLDAGPHTYIWSSPALAEPEGILVIGLSNRGTSDNGIVVDQKTLQTFRGAVVGVDAHSGALAWRFETSAAPSGAGVGVWSSAALDLERKLAFIGTGNNFYPPVSPFSDSLLAIDYRTGELAWSVQYTKNDAWTAGMVSAGGVNADVAAAPNLFVLGGRALVGVGDKAGYYHVHDRASGELIWQRFLTSGQFKGGVIAPAAFQNDVVYVVANEAYERGTVFALRAQDGELLWKRVLDWAVWGGPAVGNGVLFVATQAGEAYGLSTQTGEVRWTAKLPHGSGGGFSMACGALVVGQGFQDFESDAEPLSGGLRVYTLPGAKDDRPDCSEDTP